MSEVIVGPSGATSHGSTPWYSNVEITESCWNWLGHVSKKGYGYRRIDGITRRVHRAFYEKFVGPIPKGKVLDHLCRNRKCVRPSHLEAVTPRENVMRGIGLCAENARKTHCTQGHPYSKENTIMRGNRARVCRICNKQRHDNWIARKASA